MPESVLLSFRLNGEEVEVAAPPHWTLLEVLRYKLDLIGSKQGCDKGDCGACTAQLDGRAVLSCLTLGVAAQGREVKTVEGLTGKELHPLQDCFDKWVAAQCGFCTPGILMAADAYLTQVRRPVSRQEAAEALASNLCRCTGYTKILDAIVEASTALSHPSGDRPPPRPSPSGGGGMHSSGDGPPGRPSPSGGGGMHSSGDGPPGRPSSSGGGDVAKEDERG